MPQKIKDKVIREAKDRRRRCSGSDSDDDEVATTAHLKSHTASDTDSDSDSDTDSDSNVRTVNKLKTVSDMSVDEFAHFIDTTARHHNAKKEWKALKARLQI
ncbi:hypothetical protein H0H92_006406 [Tricholoma furcatifolium]|nr:hypothetical protein H0H92_006406 [Tricholoma furcatifolium]